MNNLHGKNILIFAATGAIAGGAARKFAAEGAHVWLSGRDPERLEGLAKSIQSEGGKAQFHVVDATDPAQVEAYVGQVATQSGAIHGVFNGIGGRPVELGYPQFSTQQPLEDFMIPLQRIVGSQFLTARAAVRHMSQNGGGAIVILSATLSSMTAPAMAGISAACGAVEALTRSLAGEFGMMNIRVNCVRGSGMPETRTIQETVVGVSNLTGTAPGMSLPPIGRPVTVADTVAAASFLLSDEAAGMTGQVLTVCGGVFV